MTETPSKTADNFENFSLADFYKQAWEPIPSKTAFFSGYFSEMHKDGFMMREALGPAGKCMQVRDASGAPSEVLMLGSNNYLDLANEPYVVERALQALRKFGIGCGGPPLLNGYTALHRELEAKLAAMKGCEDSLIFSSGYATNVGWSTGLLTAEDVLIYDAQNHASLFDGMKMGKFKAVSFAHNDIEDLNQKLMEARYQQTYTNIVVCVEGVYSMDGDIAPLTEIRRLCTKYGALLAVDDAHGTGVLGARGHGTAEHFGLEGKVDIAMGTFSKTFAVTGGYVAGTKKMIDYLRFFARSYMFSASLPPVVVASVLGGIEFMEAHPERIASLSENARYMLRRLRESGFDASCDSAILPIHVPQEVPIRALVKRLHDLGVFVNGVEYPAVARNRQRLRVSMMATFTKEELDFAIDRIIQVGDEFGFRKN